jgi:carboxyl-terminal processing protease
MTKLYMMTTLRNILFSTFFTALLLLTGVSSVHSYSDVSASDPHYDEIDYFESLQLITDSNFLPDNPVTKSEFIKILLNKNGFDITDIDDYPVAFEDVQENLKPYVEQMRKLGIVIYTPFNNTFEPNREISLRKALDMFMKFEGIPVPQLFDKNTFESKITNVGSDAFFAPLISRAINLGLIQATNKTVDVFAPLTRRQLAYMVYKGDGIQQKFEEASGNPIKRTVVVPLRINRVTDSLSKEDAFKVFEDVWGKVLKYYYGKDNLDKEKLLYGAVEGLVEAIDDPYSTFLKPELNSQLLNSLSNEIEGIGASLTMNEDNKVEIISPLSGSPAEKVGMLPGDIITKINGTSTENLTLSQVINRIKGSPGTKVDITVSRTNSLKSFTITRARIKVPNVTTEFTADNIVIIKIRNFGSGTANEVAAFIDSLKSSKIKGVILDLRNNPGGYLNAAIAIAEHFTAKGEKIVQVEYADKSKKIDSSKFTGTLDKENVVVLVNGGSASAAEILAATLKDTSDAVLIGETTYGKGTVQEITSYKDKSSLKLTIAHWLTPNGVDINGKGIDPDIKISTTDADRLAGNDPVLNRALIQLR